MSNEDKKTTMQEKIELQLHEQYAVNNNANVGSFVAMIGALMVVFTGYGYVLAKYKYPNDNVDLFDLITVVTVFVIAILYCIAVQLGANQRMEQFITYAIRFKHYNNKEEMGEIYPKGYNPFNKCITDYVQGVYNTIAYILFGCSIAVPIISGFYQEWNFEWFVKVLLFVIILGMIVWNIHLFTKYKNREKEYRKKSSNMAEPTSICGKICNYITYTMYILFPIITIVLCILGLCCDKTDMKSLLLCIIASAVYTIISVWDLWKLYKE